MKYFKRPLRRKHWAIHKFSSGLRGSKKEKWVLKIILILGTRQQVMPMRMSKKFEDRRYTVDEISEVTGVSWSSCQRILTVDLNMRCVAAKFVPRLLTQDQKTLVWLCARSWKIRLKVTQTFFLRSSRATKVGAMGTTLRPNKLRANGRCPLHRDRKSKTREVKCENNAHCFFQCSRNHALGICSSWTDCQSGILLGGFEANERECAKKMPRIVEIGRVVSPSWQCPSSHSSVCDPVFGLSGMDHRSPPTLFTGPSPLWFLFIPDNEKNIERKEICHRGGGENSFAGATQQHQASAVPEMLHSGKKESILKGIKCFLFEM